jgi:hypothetical protein
MSAARRRIHFGNCSVHCSASGITAVSGGDFGNTTLAIRFTARLLLRSSCITLAQPTSETFVKVNFSPLLGLRFFC